MKRIILFFAVCLGLSVSQTTFADNADTARAAAKRDMATNISNNVTMSGGRANATVTKRNDSPQQKNARTTTQQRVVGRQQTPQTNVKQRSASEPKTTNNVVKRVSTTARSAVSNRTVEPRKSANTSKSARSAVATKSATRNARVATLDDTKIANIKSANYSKCKTVYYDCMDEFCANKDTNLRRCACSSRIHEFDDIKKQLSDAEDKMLDFNQRLLTVSLDKEDAAAINIATEGELAFQTKDTSESEKLLQKITDTLNSSGNSKITNNLSSISLSLDMDSAWDNVDSLSGIATTAKSGLDLYNAAHPICIEMAKEVCSDDELNVVQDGYKLTIQQDCNTVAKTYDSLYNKAMEKIHESGALLDISRLTVYQQRNSDDILTCKKKILNQLSDAAVCGENLYKCLDTTGQYIDPSTGKAVLSENLYNLSTLLQEPTGDEKWSGVAQNEKFVKFLNSKKTFLEPAIKQCQDIADTVWNDFLDDALSQIKLAQNAKLEEIRQSCTTLVAECTTDALTDLSEFDSRALSIFNVAAAKTADSMCSGIKNACITLMNVANISDWGNAMADINSEITYDAIINTCTQIGRDCIIQKCNGTSGNFALCTNLASNNRAAILDRTACWNDVLACVQNAGNLDNLTLPTRNEYYKSLYGNDVDMDKLHISPKDTNDKAFWITEQIWGNCSPSGIAQNKIMIPNTDSTLLSWFASNTGTDNCNSQQSIINVILNSLKNYCKSGVRDKFNNCCESADSGYTDNGICVDSENDKAYLVLDSTCINTDTYYCPGHVSTNPRKISLYCVGTSKPTKNTDNKYTCGGHWVMIDQYGNYFYPQPSQPSSPMSYTKDSDTCTYTYSDPNWGWGNCSDIKGIPTNNEFLIEY